FQVMMRIAGGYFATVNIAGLAPNESLLVNFPNWGPVTPGWAAIKCSLYCAVDTFFPNDTLKDSSYVRGPDVGVSAILAPLDNVDMGAVITPRAIVRNYRSVAVYGVPVKLNIGAAYADSLTCDLAANGTDTVVFRDWTAAPLGLVRESCYTRMVGDMTRANDTARAWVFVRAPDCGVSQILAPTGAVEYGTVVTPQAVVRNYRSVGVNVPVKFAIQGGYQDSVTVALAGYQTDTVEFQDWNATALGLRRESCFTRLATDGNRANDTARATVWVRGRDVGITAILSPPDSTDLGGVYTPQAVVRNYRDVAVPVVPVRMYIGMGYNNIVNVALGPNQIDTVDFPNWNAAALGAFTVRCTLAVPGDSFLPNDTMSKVTIVRGPDVGAFRLLAPAGTYVPGAIVTPRARVRNYRSVAQPSVPVRMRIGAGYQRDTTVAIPAFDSVEIAFANWAANPPGMHIAKCSTRLFSDVYPPNDAVEHTVFVASRDVACTHIVAPLGTVDSGATVTPQAWLRNYGNTAEVFNCRMLIGSFYADTVSVALAAGDSVLRSFRPVTLSLVGQWAVNCSTMLGADLVPSNDRAIDSVLVRVFDVAARAIVAPVDTVDSGTVVVPRLHVANLGSTAQTFWTHFLFQPGAGPVFYRDSLRVTIAALAESVLTFGPSQPVNQLGTWRASGWCAAGDPNPQNDTAAGQFFVPGRGGISWPHGWREVASMPLLPSQRMIRDGGALTVMEDSAVGLIYATKGNKTADFYSYNCITNTWTTLTQIPTGREGKLTGKGTQLCADAAGHVYMTKGNNTLGFWRYTVADSSWTQLADVPLGTTRKKVKGGTDMAYVVKNNVGYVYLLKGDRNEFHRYNTATDSWQTMAPAPGIRIKWGKGSFLVYDHEHTIYAHKAGYNELWSYDTDRDTWGPQLTGMPLYGQLGRKKKSKDGGAGAWYLDGFYAFKGGNTQEFWQYVPARDSWFESDTIPAVGSSGRKKVKNGGDLVYNALAFWGLKGNKTLELWRYGILETSARVLDRRPEPGGVLSSPVAHRYSGNVIVPNPLLDGMAVLRLDRGLTGSPVTVRVFNATGRLVQHSAFSTQRSVVPLDLRQLQEGVYLVQVEADGAVVLQTKLVRH
ncbi:MAG: T9SS type A sorting domain-containing protein, partial [candidate division WOR-3 bacterium]